MKVCPPSPPITTNYLEHRAKAMHAQKSKRICMNTSARICTNLQDSALICRILQYKSENQNTVLLLLLLRAEDRLNLLTAMLP